MPIPLILNFTLRKLPFESVLMVLLRKYGKEITQMIEPGPARLRRNTVPFSYKLPVYNQISARFPTNGPLMTQYHPVFL